MSRGAITNGNAAGDGPTVPPSLADDPSAGTDISHLISEADQGSWAFALGCGDWLTSDDGLTVCNRAYFTARGWPVNDLDCVDYSDGESPNGLATSGSDLAPFHAGENSHD